MFTLWRSIVEWGGCFQRRLYVNITTSERLDAGWWKLAVRCIIEKSRPSSNLGSKVRVTRDKRKKCCIFLAAVLGASSCVVRKFYAGGKISARCLVILYKSTYNWHSFILLVASTNTCLQNDHMISGSYIYVLSCFPNVFMLIHNAVLCKKRHQNMKL